MLHTRHLPYKIRKMLGELFYTVPTRGDLSCSKGAAALPLARLNPLQQGTLSLTAAKLPILIASLVNSRSNWGHIPQPKASNALIAFACFFPLLRNFSRRK